MNGTLYSVQYKTVTVLQRFNITFIMTCCKAVQHTYITCLYRLLCFFLLLKAPSSLLSLSSLNSFHLTIEKQLYYHTGFYHPHNNTTKLITIINHKLSTKIHSYCLSITDDHNNTYIDSSSFSLMKNQYMYCYDVLDTKFIEKNTSNTNDDDNESNHYHRMMMIIEIKGNYSGIQLIDIISYDDSHRIIDISLSNRYYIATTNFNNGIDTIINSNKIITILAPSIGSLVYDTLNITMDDSYDVYFDVKGITAHHMENLISIHSLDGLIVEPGTWLITITPNIALVSSSSSSHDDGIIYGYPTHHYIEFVLSEEKIHNLRRFYHEIDDHHYRQSLSSSSSCFVNDTDTINLSIVNDDRDEDEDEDNNNYNSDNGGDDNDDVHDDGGVDDEDQINVCIYSNDVMDGQKTIWIQQSQYMNDFNRNIHFTWFLDMYDDNPVMLSLLKINEYYDKKYKDDRDGDKHHHPHHLISIKEDVQFKITQNDLQSISYYNDEYNDDVIQNDDHHHNWKNNITIIFKYIYDRFIIANRNISNIQPLWCKKFYLLLQQQLLSENCNIIVYGNPRHFNIYSLVLLVSDLLLIPSVTELCNHYLNEFMIPTVIVAPSIHAIEHDGLNIHESQSSLSSASTSVIKMVIPPSVDTNKFRPYDDMFDDGLTSTPPYHHPSCNIISNSMNHTHHHHHPCVVIGFIARLAPGLSFWINTYHLFFIIFVLDYTLLSSI